MRQSDPGQCVDVDSTLKLRYDMHAVVSTLRFEFLAVARLNLYM
jgi:hypothetical protein